MQFLTRRLCFVVEIFGFSQGLKWCINFKNICILSRIINKKRSRDLHYMKKTSKFRAYLKLKFYLNYNDFGDNF